MSRIGRLPVALKAGITAEFKNGVVTVKGPKGTLTQPIENKHINVTVEGNQVHVTRDSEAKEVRAAHGLYRALIHNMVVGVEQGYKKEMVLAGVGYKAVQQGNKVVLSVGYSHTVDVVPPEGITVKVTSATEFVIEGIDKTKVGQFAADVKRIRKPEPYHGYGIRYKDETIIRKEGKKAGK